MDTQPPSASDDLWSYFVPVVLGGVALLAVILAIVLFVAVRNSEGWRPAISDRWRNDRWRVRAGDGAERPLHPAPPSSAEPPADAPGEPPATPSPETD